MPIIFASLLQSAYTVADLAIVGKFLGSDGLSALGIGGILTGLLYALSMGLSFGGQILLAHSVGSSDHTRIQKGVGTLLTLSIPFALLSGLLCAVFTSPLLNILHTPAEIFDSARAYFVICCIGAIGMYGFNSMLAIFRSIGETRLPMLFTGISTVLNIGLDLLFIGVMHWNIWGAALAMVISQASSLIMSSVFLYMRRSVLGFDFRPHSFRIDRKTCSALLKFATPIIVFGLLISLSTMFINSSVNKYGVAASAADGIWNKLFMATGAIPMGLSTAGVIMIGQNFGARKLDRIKKIYFAIMLFSLAGFAMMAIPMLIFPVQIFRIFTGDAAVLAFAPRFIPIYVLGMFGFACAGNQYSLFEGIGVTKLEMISGIIENLIGKLVLCTILGGALGLMGYWLGKACSALMTPVFGFIYYFSGAWKKRLFFEKEVKEEAKEEVKEEPVSA